MSVPIIEDLGNISPENLAMLMEHGIAFAKIPDSIFEKLKRIETIGLAYFRQDKTDKAQEIFTPKNKEGFLDQTKLGYDIERFVTRGSAPQAGMLMQCRDDMLEARTFFNAEIIFPFLNRIFAASNISEHLEEVIDNPDSALSLIYYPSGDLPELRMDAHKDTILMSILWVQQTGYKAVIDGKWRPMQSKPGYVIIQLGRGLAMMTDGQCQAVEHKVDVNRQIDRLAMVLFFGPNLKLPFKNYVTGARLYNTFGEYMREDLAKAYKDRTAPEAS